MNVEFLADEIMRGYGESYENLREHVVAVLSAVSPGGLVITADKDGGEIGPMYVIGPFPSEEAAGAEVDKMSADPRWKNETIEVPVLNPPGTAFEELRQ